jgi:hypothetical protein
MGYIITMIYYRYGYTEIRDHKGEAVGVGAGVHVMLMRASDPCGRIGSMQWHVFAPCFFSGERERERESRWVVSGCARRKSAGTYRRQGAGEEVGLAEEDATVLNAAPVVIRASISVLGEWQERDQTRELIAAQSPAAYRRGRGGCQRRYERSVQTDRADMHIAQVFLQAGEECHVGQRCRERADKVVVFQLPSKRDSESQLWKSKAYMT